MSDDIGEAQPTGRFDRVIEAVKRLRARLGTGRGRVAMLVVSGCAFAAIFGVSLVNLPPVDGGIRWTPLVLLALIGYPVLVACMSAQYRQSARFVGVRVGLRESSTIAVLSAAANLLPLPGSLLMRSEALAQRGVRYRRAIAASTIIGLGWLTATCILVFVAALGNGRSLAVAAVLVGSAAIAGTAHLAGSVADGGPPSRSRVVSSAVLLGLSIALVAATNQWLVLVALRLDVSWGDAVVISSSSVLAATVGFFPGGLGLREAFAAGLAASVGVPASVGVVAVSLTRIVGMGVLLVLTLVVALLEHQSPHGITDMRGHRRISITGAEKPGSAPED